MVLIVISWTDRRVEEGGKCNSSRILGLFSLPPMLVVRGPAEDDLLFLLAAGGVELDRLGGIFKLAGRWFGGIGDNKPLGVDNLSNLSEIAGDLDRDRKVLVVVVVVVVVLVV
jgi:hypothetical protein